MSRYGRYGGYGWRPYVPVAVRRGRALKKMEKLRKKGLDVQPVEIEGRKIARTFWGAAWCDHLESFSDYENRLPRGRTYVRNGSVCHLDIGKGEIKAMVSGSELYNVKITIKTLARKKWSDVKKRCAGQVGSVLELLQGKLSGSVMEVVTDRNRGLFPLPREISLGCDCPDWAVMCKHVAAVLYGVGARLDEKPEMLFLLRGVDHDELIDAEVGIAAVTAGAEGGRKRIADDELADVFGIEMSEEKQPAKAMSSRRRKKAAPKPKKARKAKTQERAKRRTEVGREATQGRKKPATRKAGVKRTPRATPEVGPLTGEAVARLRARFGMSRSQFARLLGVSAPSIGNWEKEPGTLNLQRRTLGALRAAMGLTKRQAMKKLSGS